MGEHADRPGARDDEVGDEDEAQERSAPPPPPSRPPAAQPPVDRALARLGGGLRGRSLSVYGVLLAGAAVLLLLLAIIWITAGDGDDDSVPTCLNIEPNDVLNRIKAGDVERVRVSLAESDPSLGPVALSVETTDGACHLLQPQGVEGQPDIYTVVGAIDYYNATSDGRQIDLTYDERDDLRAELFWTPSPVPTVTVEPTATVPIPTDVPASPTALPATETPAPTGTPTPPVLLGSPQASPARSPVVPQPAPTETPLG